MVENDRKELNDRFKVVYKLLEQRGEIVKSHPNKSKSAFAERILGSKQYGHIVTQFLTDRRYIDYKHARKLCHEYGVNESYILDGIGSAFGEALGRYRTIPKESAEAFTPKGNILFTTTEAFAGWTGGVQSFVHENNHYFSFPGLKGNGLVAFHVKGSSMEPLINSGDMVICKELENVNELKDNEIYAVKHNGQLWIKHVKKLKNAQGRLTRLLLTSSNYLDHPPFVEEVNRTTQLYKVIRHVKQI